MLQQEGRMWPIQLISVQVHILVLLEDLQTRRDIGRTNSISPEMITCVPRHFFCSSGAGAGAGYTVG